MNKAAFLQIVRQVSPIQDQEVEDLEKLVVSFPYCQTAHVLLAKAAVDRGSMLSNQKLRKAAAHVSNRQLLKRLVYDLNPSDKDKTALVPAIAESLLVDTPEAVLAPIFEKEAENATVLDLVTEDIPQDIQDQIPLEKQEEKVSPQEVAPLEEETYIRPAEEILPEKEADISTDVLFDVPALPLEKESEITESESFVLDEANIADSFHADEVDPETETEPDTVVETAFTPVSEEAPSGLQANSQRLAPEDELLNLIQISGLVSFTTPNRSVNLTHQEIVSEIVSTTEAKQQLAAETGQAEVEVHLKSTVEAESEPEQRFLEHPATAPVLPPLPEETGYAFPTLQVPATLPNSAEKVAADPYLAVYTQNHLAYWMGSSRLGECLQVKDEVTTALPYFFQPELILEHIKGNGTIQKEAEKAPVARLDIQLDIINQFLKTTPRRKTLANVQQKSEPQEDLSAKSTKIKKNFTSENLAQIFIKQGKAKKAAKIYEQLIVKFPEKRSYFAQQIEKLRNES